MFLLNIYFHAIAMLVKGILLCDDLCIYNVNISRTSIPDMVVFIYTVLISTNSNGNC